MSLIVHVHGGYPSYEGSGAEWGQFEYDAFKLVQTLKGKPINRYATLKTIGGKWVKITTANPEGAFELWGAWSGAKVQELVPDGALLVPIPSADCLAIGADEKGRALANATKAYAPNCEVAEMLHWNQQYAKASEGGPRDYATLFENFRVLTDQPKREVVLIDDVVTGGGHLRAAANVVRWAGHEVRYAVCVARTVSCRPSNGMFAVPPWDAESVCEI